MFFMCSELTPRARIPDTRIPQLMQPWAGGDMLSLSDKLASEEEIIQLITSKSNHHHASKTQSVSQKRLLKDKKRISTDASKTSTNISLHLLLPQNGFRNIQAALCFQELKL